MTRTFQDDIKQAAYENACDCLYYGYGKKIWNKCGLSESESNPIWRKAQWDMAKS